MEYLENSPKKKKKVDYAALNSPFMRIPRFSVECARLLLDLGFQQIYELQGRSPEVLLEESTQQRGKSNPDALAHLRMAVYFAETEQPDPAKLYPQSWT